MDTKLQRDVRLLTSASVSILVSLTDKLFRGRDRREYSSLMKKAMNAVVWVSMVIKKTARLTRVRCWLLIDSGKIRRWAYSMAKAMDSIKVIYSLPQTSRANE